MGTGPGPSFFDAEQLNGIKPNLVYEAISNLHLRLDGRGLMRIDHVNGDPNETISKVG